MQTADPATGNSQIMPLLADPGACMHELFEAQAARTPDAPALSYRDRTLTYAQLNARANRLAHRLRALGVGPEVSAGLCLDRSVELIVGLLGILKAGGAYVPLDPDLSRRPAGLHRRRRRPGPAGHAHGATRAPVHAGDAPSSWWTTGTSTARTRRQTRSAAPARDNLAYIIYTSGSTGRPKGVMVSHRGLGNLAAIAARLFAPGRATGVLQYASISFDASVCELLRPWRTAPRSAWPTGRSAAGAGPDPAAGRARDHHRAALPGGAQRCCPTRRCRRLRVITVGGEACTPDWSATLGAGPPVLQRLRADRGDGGRDLRGCRPGPARRPSAGRSPTRQVYMLDARGQPVPLGVAGRAVHRRGRAGARLPRPARPDRRAVRPRSRSAACPGARLYRTGDLARRPARRQHRVPGPRRRPGEDPRLPHRAGRDRGRAGGAPGGARGGRRGARGRAGRQAPGGLRDRRRRRPRPRRRAARLLRERCRSTWCRRASSRWTRCR